MIESNNKKMRAFVYDESPWRKIIDDDYILNDPAQVNVYTSAIALPLQPLKSNSEGGASLFEGGVCSQDFQYLAGLERSCANKRTNRSCVQSYPVKQEDIEVRDETVIYGGILSEHFGHMLYDTTTRLWHTVTDESKEYKVIFLCYPNSGFSHTEFLELAGIDGNRMEIIEKPTQFSRIIVPDETCYSINPASYRKEWISFFDSVRDKVISGPYEKIYLTRTAFQIDNCIGEEYFEEFYRKQGFKIISPEQHSITEQISFITGAKEIAATAGTIAILSLFAQPGTKVTVLNRSRDLLKNLCMAQKARKLDVSYVDVQASFFPEIQIGNSIFLLFPTSCWKEYVASRPDFSISEDEYTPNFETIYNYVLKWGQKYTDSRAFANIKNYDMTDIVYRVNQYFLDNEIDTTNYPKPNKIVRAETIIRNLNKDTDIALLNYSQCLAAVSDRDDNSVILSGYLDIPFCDPTTLVLTVYVVRDSVSDHLSEMIALQNDVTFEIVDDQYSWSVRIEYRDLSKIFNPDGEIQQHKESLYLEIRNQVTDKKAFMSNIILYRNPCGDWKIFSKEEATNAFLDSASYYIEKMSWKKNVLKIAGDITLNSSQSDVMGTALIMKEFENEVEYCSFEAKTIFDKNSERAFWSSDIDMHTFFGYLDNLTSAQKRWDIYLRVYGLDYYRDIRIGEKRDASQYYQYTKALFVYKDHCIIPSDTGRKNLSFYQWSQNVALNKSKDYRIIQTKWLNDSTLRINGWLKTFLACSSNMKVAFSLRAKGDEDERFVEYPVKVELSDKDAQKLLWKTIIDLKALPLYGFDQQSRKPSLWDMYLDVSLGENRLRIRIGSKGNSEAIEEFLRKNAVKIDRNIFKIEQTSEGNWSLRERSADKKQASLLRRLYRGVKKRI